MKNAFKYVIVALLGILAALFFYNKYKVAPAVDLTKLILFDTEGNPVKLSDMKGRKMVVSFGASWCPNCIDELKMINSIQDKELKDIEIVVISDEAMEKVIAFKERKGYRFTFLKMNQSFNSIGINSIPTTYLVNKNFEIKDETVGFIDWEDLSTVEHIRKLLE
jgi:peroxiredoxin